MTIDVFERYAALDPAKVPGIQPEWPSTIKERLSIPDGKEPIMGDKEPTLLKRQAPRRSRTGPFVAVSAAALLLVAATLLVSRNVLGATPAAISTLEAPVMVDSETDLIVTKEQALAAANNYILAFNVGAGEKIMALFIPEATFGDNLEFESTRQREEMWYAFNAAQGTIITSRGCTVDVDQEAATASVTCRGANHDALSQALPAPPVPFTVKMDVTANGISALQFTHEIPYFNATVFPFLGWMRVNHPNDASKMVFGAWDTIAEATDYGELRVQYAREWADFLEENGCTYKDGC
jgi:hypothetical protein